MVASVPSADTLKPAASPSGAPSCDRFAARLRLGQPDADDTLTTGFDLDDEIRREVKDSGLNFFVKRNARREDVRMWIEQANEEHCEPAYSYCDEKDGHVGRFRRPKRA